MIRVPPVTEPPDWNKRGKAPGLAWLERNPGPEDRPKNTWSPFRDYLAEGFSRRCGYTTVRVEVGGTIDHFRPWSELRDTPEASLAWEWSNLRFCSEWFNAKRRSRPALDPYVVEDDWFELLLPSCQLVATDRVPPEHQSLADDMLERWLGHDEELVRHRSAWLENYESGWVNLELLDAYAPLVARAVRARSARAG